jgi:hypothetical protein
MAAAQRLDVEFTANRSELASPLLEGKCLTLNALLNADGVALTSRMAVPITGHPRWDET